MCQVSLQSQTELVLSFEKIWAESHCLLQLMHCGYDVALLDVVLRGFDEKHGPPIVGLLQVDLFEFSQLFLSFFCLPGFFECLCQNSVRFRKIGIQVQSLAQLFAGSWCVVQLKEH